METGRNIPLQATGTSLSKPVGRSQVSHSTRTGSGITEMQIRRIVAALEQGQAERNIAEAERIAERYVRQIRALHIGRLRRQMSAVGTAWGGMLEAVRTMHREIDEQAFEELRESA